MFSTGILASAVVRRYYTFPGCGAARSGAPLIRDRSGLSARNDPGSAAHHHSARQTRVNALMVLRCARETSLMAAARPLIRHRAAQRSGVGGPPEGWWRGPAA